MKKIMMNSLFTVPALAAIFLVGCHTKQPKVDDSATMLPPDAPLSDVGEAPKVKDVPAPVEETKPAAVETVAAEESTIYTIRKNDTISGVAVRYGVRWQDVMAINPGINPKRLRVGQTIRLPGKIDIEKPVAVSSASGRRSASIKAPVVAAVSGPTTTYVVRKGDVLSTIALRHGVKVAAIRTANPKLKGDKIFVGQKLVIPAGKKKSSQGKTSKKVDAKPVSVSAGVKTAAEAKPATPKVEVKEEVKPAAPKVEVKEEVTLAAPKVEVKEEVKTAAPAPATAANTTTYTVKEGEDVFAVAIRWGISVNALKELNNLTTNELKAGQVLRIPADSLQ